MHHIGNDVVDLNDPPNRGKSRDRRFVNRVFTPAEQRAILESAGEDAALWSIWAAKESAYKAAAKSGMAVHSIPRLYEVDLSAGSEEGGACGVVKTPAGIVHVRVFACRDYVHGLAVTDSERHLAGVVSQVRRAEDLTADESERARAAGTACLSRHLGLPEEAVFIGRNGSVPYILIHGLPVRMDVSLSHDGHYTACAFSPVD